LLVTLSVITVLVLIFTFGGKGLAFTLLSMPALAYYEVKRKIPVKSVLAVILIFVFIIIPVYNTFRQLNRHLDMTRRVDRTFEMASKWNSDKYLDASLFAFLKRITIVTSIAAVVSDTGRWVDYRYGETLILAPIGLLIPRFLWPDKPNISIGQEFGETFRLKGDMDRETYIAASMVGDFYWNFSVAGVVVGMWILGMCARWYYQRYGAGSGFDPIRKSIYFTLLPTALAFESNVALLVGAVIKLLVILIVFLIVCQRLGWLEESSPV
jgi:oligosaccharide repeat unit polymerase